MIFFDEDDRSLSDHDQEIEETIDSLLKELNIGAAASKISKSLSLDDEFKNFEKLNTTMRKNLAFDISMVVGSSGDWQTALKIINDDTLSDTENVKILAWKLRCLVENDRFAEAIATWKGIESRAANKKQVAYLAYKAFDALGMRKESEELRRQLSKVSVN